MEPKTKEAYFLYTLLAGASLLCIAIFLPFLSVIAIGGVLAVVLHKPFAWIRSHLPQSLKFLAAILTVFLFLFILAIPLTFIGVRVTYEAGGLYSSLSHGGSASQYLNDLSAKIYTKFPEASLIDIKSRFGDMIGFFASHLTTIFTSTLQTIITFVLIMLSLFYFLQDGEEWLQYAMDLSPLARERNDKLVRIIARSINGVLTGYIFMAIIWGSLLGFGLWIFGIPNPALWGLLAGTASIIPPFGTAVISVPSIVYLFATGNTTHALGLTIWTLVLVGIIDNFLNPMIVGKKVELPPFVVLFAVLGGIALLGPAGILIGPMATSLLYALVRMYREDLAPRQSN